MSDLSAFRVPNFSGRKEEWPIWSEKFLAKAKRSGIKDVLLGTLQIPKTSEKLEEKSEKGRRMMKNADLNKLALKELILSIDLSNSSEKIGRIMKMGMQLMPGRSSRRSLTQYLHLHY
jgi:hypothetical protein